MSCPDIWHKPESIARDGDRCPTCKVQFHEVTQDCHDGRCSLGICRPAPSPPAEECPGVDDIIGEIHGVHCRNCASKSAEVRSLQESIETHRVNSSIWLAKERARAEALADALRDTLMLLERYASRFPPAERREMMLVINEARAALAGKKEGA